MVKVKFEAANIADLKLQIQEYSLAHLGLNFKELIKNSGAGKPGETDAVMRKDGTMVMHNPSYPSKMKNVPEPEKRGRGRPVGWRKEKPEVAAEPVPLGTVNPTTPPEQASPAVTSGPTKEQAVKAIHALHAISGIAACMELLKNYAPCSNGEIPHINNVDPSKYADLIADFERKANEPHGAALGDRLSQP